jgi:hypothetical protein
MKRTKKFKPVEYVVSADSPLDLSEVGRSAPEPARRERFEHPERTVEAEPDSTPAVLTAEAIQRQANRSRHSERTYNGGKRLG